MSGNFVVTSGKQIAAFFSKTYGIVCSACYVKSMHIEQYALGPAEAEIIIKGVNPRHTTLEALGVERPASELTVDELMKIVYQKLDQRQ